MKIFDDNEIVSVLSRLDIQSSDILLVHSSLIHLGRYSGANVSDIPKQIVNLLLEYLGETGTLVVPTFNFDFCNGIPFDRWNTPSKMGVLSETVRSWPGAQRSKHPMQSVAGIGHFASEICEPDNYSSFAIGGPFDIMLTKKSKMLFLGAPFQTASLIHYTEERLGVPYRYWKRFSSVYIDGAINEPRHYGMFVRRLDLNPQLLLKVVEEEMESRSLIRKYSLGMGQVTYCDFDDFINVTMEMVGADPYMLLKNRSEVCASIKEEQK